MAPADRSRRRPAPEPERPEAIASEREGSVPPAERLLALQRSAGNQATVRSLQRWDWRDVVDPLGVSSAIGGLIGMIASGIVDQGQFKAAVHAARDRPVWRAEWDAWGHALCAASSAGLGGEGHAYLFGQGREELQEALSHLGITHDSYAQDTHNQAVGRSIATESGMGSSLPELVSASNQAYLQGRMLVGPERNDAWMPWMGPNQFHEVSPHDGRKWVPASADYGPVPEGWVEAVQPGPRGQARGGEAAPG